jgi:tetratricopeptide (TPR) repeat protein
LASFKNKDYKTALSFWSSVIEMYPDYSKGLKADYNKALTAQIDKAKVFYQTGLVYEGLNNMDNARSNWQKALDELPVENSEYYLKAQMKLGGYRQN